MYVKISNIYPNRYANNNLSNNHLNIANVFFPYTPFQLLFILLYLDFLKAFSVVKIISTVTFVQQSSNLKFYESTKLLCQNKS